MDDLDKLIPQPAELAVGGEALAIHPLKVGRLPAFLRAISPTLQQLNAPSIDWLELFIEHGDDLLQAVLSRWTSHVRGSMRLQPTRRSCWRPR